MHAVKTYDVIIIGAGPAGIFTALELADKGFKILMVEKGQDIRERIATSLNKKALPKDKMRNVVCGWGGAGAFSDGKLTLTTEYGGNLDDYMSKADLMDKIRYVDDVYCRFGGAGRKVYGDENKECIRDIKRKAAAADLRFIPARIRHLGTDVNAQILTNMRDFLEGKVDIMADTAVDHIVEEKGEIKGVLIGGQFYACRYLVSAPGREGSEWFVHEVEKMGLKLTSNAVDIGVRVEMPAEVLQPPVDGGAARHHGHRSLLAIVRRQEQLVLAPGYFRQALCMLRLDGFQLAKLPLFVPEHRLERLDHALGEIDRLHHDRRH